MTSRHARSAFASAGVVGLIFFLGIVAFALAFVTGTTQNNVAREVAGQTYMDACYSGLAEARTALRSAATGGTSLGSLDMSAALGNDFPFEPVSIPIPHTKKLFDTLHPGLTIPDVILRAGPRTPPGYEPTLIGFVELVARAEGKLGGFSTGREVVQSLIFKIPCSAGAEFGGNNVYHRYHWGPPFLMSDPALEKVTRL